MKKVFSFFLFFFLLHHYTFAQQPTPAEIQKQLDEALKKAEQSTNDPAMKAAIEEAKKMSRQPDKIPGTTDPGTSSKSSTRRLPVKNSSPISAITKKTFTKAELVAYCGDLYKQLAGKISPARVKTVNDMMIKPGGNSYKFNLAAVGSWYNGAAEEAVLIATKAVVQNADDDVLLNNLSAMLNMGGLEQKAIPLLRTLVQKYPDNPMVLNNMGQAFAGLGAADTAMFYLGRCIAKSPNHPEANNTAGQIELSKGNRQKATEHFEQSLKGAYNKDAANALRYLDPQAKYGKLIRPRVHIPEYFNLYKYKLPAQCESLSQGAIAKAEHEAYKEMLTRLLKKYEAIQKEETEMTEKTLIKKYIIDHSQNYPPFLELGTAMLVETSIDYSNEFMALDGYNQHFSSELKKLETGYMLAVDKSGCIAANNSYLPLFASLRRDWQVKNLDIEKKYLDELIYWSFLASHNIHDFRKNFYSLVTGALGHLHILAETKLPYYTCEEEQAGKQTMEEPALTEPECPFSVDVKFIVGKLSLDCEKLSFSGGEGFIFNYEKKIKGGQSTISLGIGAQLALGGGFGGVNAGAEASIGECLFIALDANGHATDGGLKFNVKAAAGAGLDGAIGKSVNIKKDLSGIEAGAGYTIGIESGIKFDEGPLKNLLNPPENPLNKNIPIYKQGG